jgi:hypothetical protein
MAGTQPARIRRGRSRPRTYWKAGRTTIEMQHPQPIWYNPPVVEMKRGASPQTRRRVARARVRLIAWLLVLGLLALGLGPLYAYLVQNYSGQLVLAQRASAAEVARGVDFGPVYLEQGVPGRYFITARLPQIEGDFWHTAFEVLDEQRTPVFRQDELRIAGSFDFTPGKSERSAKRFVLDKETGYYFFRFSAVNGVYDANLSDPPVVQFAVRLGVIHGLGLWLPTLGLVGLGILLISLGCRMVKSLGASLRGSSSHPGKRAPARLEGHGAHEQQRGYGFTRN